MKPFQKYLSTITATGVGRQLGILTATGGVAISLSGVLFFLGAGLANEFLFLLWIVISGAIFFFFYEIARRIFVEPTQAVLTRIAALQRASQAETLSTVSNEWTRILVHLDRVSTEFAKMKACCDNLLTGREAQKNEFEKLTGFSAHLEQSLKNATMDATNLKLVGKEMNQDAMNIVSVSKSSSDISTQGIEYVEKSKNAMMEIRDSERDILESNEKVKRYINEVNEIIVMVSGISAQSTLLAVNASIQAAKAGEAGLAFSVVAREMKTLSMNSKQATKRAVEIIRNIKSAISEMQQHVEVGQSRTERGTAILDKAEETISRLREIISTVSEIANIISASANEQTLGLETVDKTVTQLYEIAVSCRRALQKHQDGFGRTDF